MTQFLETEARQLSLKDKLTAVFGRRFIKSNDMCVTDKVVLHPGFNQVPVVMMFDAAFPIEKIDSDLALVWEKSTRSRWAQLGLDVGIFKEYELPFIQSHWSDIQNRNPVIVTMLVRNLSSRKIIIQENTGLFRYYTGLAAHSLRGQELIESIERGQIKIEGEKEIDWKYLYDPSGFKQKSNRMGIQMRLKPEKYWIPPGAEPIDFAGEGGTHGREMVAKLKKPLPNPIAAESLIPVLWTAETVGLQLDQTVNAVISPIVVDTNSTRAPYAYAGEQIMSLVIDGRVTRHPVVTEIYSPMAPEYMPNWVRLFFCKDQS